MSSSIMQIPRLRQILYRLMFSPGFFKWQGVFFFCCVLASLAGQAQRSPVYNLIDYYSKTGCWDNSYNSTLWNIASQLVDGTNYRGKVKINQAPSSDYINLYVYSKDPDSAFPKCNCAYLGQGNVIVCDKKAIEYFSSLIFLNPESKILT